MNNIPDKFLPLVLDLISPLDFPKLCMINEKMAKLTGKIRAEPCRNNNLPPIGIPKHLLLFQQMFNDNKHMMYGTSHIRDVLVKENRTSDIQKLDILYQQSIEKRRETLKEFLKNGKLPIFFDPESFKENVIGIWLSKETFSNFFSLVNEIHEIINNDTRQSLFQMKRFIKAILNNDDYIANWCFLPILLDFEDTYIQSQELIKFMQKIIDGIRKSLIYKLDINKFAPKKTKFTRTIPKGTLFYRGYRTYRGVHDNVKDFAWFAFDVVSTMNYLIPPLKEDNKNYLPENIIFQDSYKYCAGLGGTAVFQTTKDVQVLDFSDIKTLKNISKELVNAAEEIRRAFESGWRLNDNDFNRVSIDKYDAEFVSWLCSNNYGGYIAGNVKGLHDEVLLCSISSNMKYIGDYDPRIDMNFTLCDYPYSKMNTTLLYF